MLLNIFLTAFSLLSFCHSLFFVTFFSVFHFLSFYPVLMTLFFFTVEIHAHASMGPEIRDVFCSQHSDQVDIKMEQATSVAQNTQNSLLDTFVPTQTGSNHSASYTSKCWYIYSIVRYIVCCIVRYIEKYIIYYIVRYIVRYIEKYIGCYVVIYIVRYIACYIVRYIENILYAISKDLLYAVFLNILKNIFYILR